MLDLLSDRMNSISLRTKITGVTVLLVTLGLLVAGVGTMTVLRTSLLQEVDDNIKSTVLGMSVTRLQADRCTFTGADDFYVAVFGNGGVICDNVQDDPPILSDMSQSNISVGEQLEPFNLWSQDRGKQWRTVAVPGVGGDGEAVALIVAQNLDGTNTTITSFAAIFLGFGISVVILGAALTWVLVTSTFGPLRQVERTAAAIAGGNFSERLPGAMTPNTEVGRLNRSLNTMLSRIDRAFGDRARTIEQMRRFVGDASHELRTPLVSVRGYAELYRMGALKSPDDVGQAMERIEKEAIRMGGLVEDLLELARIDEAKPVQRAPVDLVPIAYDAASDTMASAPDRVVDVVFIEPDEVAGEASTEQGDSDEPVDEPIAPPTRGTSTVTRPIALAGARLARLRPRRTRSLAVEESPEEADANDTEMTLDTPAVVLAEENKIRQVVTNLLGNAMRFTNAGTPIEIGVGVDPARSVATLDIIDHGDGIPSQIREKIFQRFWRADTSRTRETGGSGLGLAIVAGIVIAHQGTVDVFETEGGGATFRVVLPLLPRDWTPDPSPVAD